MTLTVCVVVPVILLAAALFELATLPVGVQGLATQVGKLVKVPLVEQVVLPLPEYPVSHVTLTICVVVPVILPAVALLEYATCVAVQALAVHINVLNLPFVPHVAVPPPAYPVLHDTAILSPVVPVIELATDLSLFATCVVAQFLAVHSTIGLHFESEPHTVAFVPDHPVSHVTVTLTVTSPIMESVAALFEFFT